MIIPKPGVSKIGLLRSRIGGMDVVPRDHAVGFLHTESDATASDAPESVASAAELDAAAADATKSDAARRC